MFDPEEVERLIARSLGEVYNSESLRDRMLRRVYGEFLREFAQELGKAKEREDYIVLIEETMRALAIMLATVLRSIAEGAASDFNGFYNISTMRFLELLDHSLATPQFGRIGEVTKQ